MFYEVHWSAKEGEKRERESREIYEDKQTGICL